MAKSELPRKTTITPMEFVGSQMSNFLHNLAYHPSLLPTERAEAKQLQLKWDTLSNFGYKLNPIVAAELDRKFFNK